MKTKIPPRTIGIDLGDKRHAICVLDDAGDIVEQRSITNHKESIRRLSRKHGNARMIMETGTHSPWISRMLQELGHEVIVANARKLRVRLGDGQYEISCSSTNRIWQTATRPAV